MADELTPFGSDTNLKGTWTPEQLCIGFGNCKGKGKILNPANVNGAMCYLDTKINELAAAAMPDDDSEFITATIDGVDSAGTPFAAGDPVLSIDGGGFIAVASLAPEIGPAVTIDGTTVTDDPDTWPALVEPYKKQCVYDAAGNLVGMVDGNGAHPIANSISEATAAGTDSVENPIASGDQVLTLANGDTLNVSCMVNKVVDHNIAQGALGVTDKDGTVCKYYPETRPVFNGLSGVNAVMDASTPVGTVISESPDRLLHNYVCDRRAMITGWHSYALEGTVGTISVRAQYSLDGGATWVNFNLGGDDTAGGGSVDSPLNATEMPHVEHQPTPAVPAGTKIRYRTIVTANNLQEGIIKQFSSHFWANVLYMAKC